MSNQEQKIKRISRIKALMCLIIVLMFTFFMSSSVIAQVIPNNKVSIGENAGIRSLESEKDAPLLYRVYAVKSKSHIKTIKFDVPINSQVKLFIEDKNGNVVKAFLYDNLNPGRYEIHFNSADLEKGDYVCRFSAGDFKKTFNLISEK